jgi:hypothetical protein
MRPSATSARSLRQNARKAVPPAWSRRRRDHGRADSDVGREVMEAGAPPAETAPWKVIRGLRSASSLHPIPDTFPALPARAGEGGLWEKNAAKPRRFGPWWRRYLLTLPPAVVGSEMSPTHALAVSEVLKGRVPYRLHRLRLWLQDRLQAPRPEALGTFRERREVG